MSIPSNDTFPLWGSDAGSKLLLQAIQGCAALVNGRGIIEAVNPAWLHAAAALQRLFHEPTARVPGPESVVVIPLVEGEVRSRPGHPGQDQLPPYLGTVSQTKPGQAHDVETSRTGKNVAALFSNEDIGPVHRERRGKARSLDELRAVVQLDDPHDRPGFPLCEGGI